MTNPLKTFGRRLSPDAIREWREKAGLTHDQLAHSVYGERHPYIIRNIESGKSGVGIAFLHKFCKALGCHLDDIVPKTRYGPFQQLPLRPILSFPRLLTHQVNRVPGMLMVGLAQWYHAIIRSLLPHAPPFDPDRMVAGYPAAAFVAPLARQNAAEGGDLREVCGLRGFH